MSVFGVNFGNNEEQFELYRLINENNRPIIFATGKAGTGKALLNGTPVLTESGWKPIEQLTLNDRVAGKDGKFYNITGIYPQGEKEIYRVTFSDRTFVDCCEEHLWAFQTRAERGNRKGAAKNNYFPHVETLKTILQQYPLQKWNGPSNLFIPMCEPIEFEEKKHFIPPYVLGCLLGDGHIGSSAESTEFSNEDSDVLDRFSQLIKPLGMRLAHNQDYDYYLRYILPQRGIGPFKQELHRLNLVGTNSATKFIPQEYLFDSVENRLELVKGLIDTDGYCEGSSYDITLKSPQLIENLKFVIESLGMTATQSVKKACCSNAKNGKKDCGLVYRLHIKTSEKIQKIHFSAKRERQWRKPQAWARRNIEKIEPLNQKGQMTCISVNSPDHLFITKNCIVTHNTYVTLACALQLQEDHKYSQIIYARNPVQVGESMGYLKGDIDEKYLPFMGALDDNLANIARSGCKGDTSRGGRAQQKARAESLRSRIEICPIAFLRGRSFEDSIVIIDEAQNLDLTALKTVLTRVGRYCKIVLLGSMNQIDDYRQRKQPVCDFQKVIDKLIDKPYVGYVELKQSMRSPICVEVDDLLGEIDRADPPQTK